MAVHYERALLALAKERKAQPATIAVGKDQIWQGVANTEAQILLLQMIDDAIKRDAAAELSRQQVANAEAKTLTIPGMEGEGMNEMFRGAHPDIKHLDRMPTKKKGGKPKKAKVRK